MPKKKTPHRRVRNRARNPTSLRGFRAAVVGLNGIGRQIALLLASSSVRSLHLVDQRTVTRRGQRIEGYGHPDTGRMKAHATAQACHEANPTLDILTHTDRSEPNLSGVDVVFRCCDVDYQEEVGKAGTIVAFEVVANNSGRGTIETLCETQTGQPEFVSASPVPPAVAAIVAGMAVQGFAAWRSGHRHTRRFTLGDRDFFITLD